MQPVLRSNYGRIKRKLLNQMGKQIKVLIPVNLVIAQQQYAAQFPQYDKLSERNEGKKDKNDINLYFPIFV